MNPRAIVFGLLFSLILWAAIAALVLGLVWIA